MILTIFFCSGRYVAYEYYLALIFQLILTCVSTHFSLQIYAVGCKYNLTLHRFIFKFSNMLFLNGFWLQRPVSVQVHLAQTHVLTTDFIYLYWITACGMCASSPCTNSMFVLLT
jgi:hypothetical protein